MPKAPLLGELASDSSTERFKTKENNYGRETLWVPEYAKRTDARADPGSQCGAAEFLVLGGLHFFFRFAVVRVLCPQEPAPGYEKT